MIRRSTDPPAPFPTISLEEWRQKVEKDLGGASFDRRLVTRTHEGIALQPLYTSSDWPSDGDRSGFPGLQPYIRGDVPMRPDAGWSALLEVSDPDPRDANAALRDLAERGMDGAVIRFDSAAAFGFGGEAREGRGGVVCADLSDLEVVLQGIDLNRFALVIDGGATAPALAGGVRAIGRGATSLHGCGGIDPLGTLARDGVWPGVLDDVGASLVDLVRDSASATPSMRALLVSTTPYHDAGATAVDELGIALATGARYLRWFTDAGVEPAVVASQMLFQFSVSSDIFMEVAKLRAARWLWSKVLAAVDGVDPTPMTILGRTSHRTLTVRDPWVNPLRVTVQTFAGAVGGADLIVTSPLDEAFGLADGESRHLAANTQAILQEESHLGRVLDPTGGSWYTETLTIELARAAWARFQAIESSGGMAEALTSGTIQSEIAGSAEARARSVATRRDPIVGVSEYALANEEPLERPALHTADLRQAAATRSRGDQGLATLTETLPGDDAPTHVTPLPAERVAERFEALRTASDAATAGGNRRPRVFLATIGPVARHKPRADYATAFFTAGGFEVIPGEGLETPDAATGAFRTADGDVAVICGTDDDYVTWVPELASRLKEAGAGQVLVAGRPGDHEHAWRESGVDGFIHLGCNVYETLHGLLVELGVMS